ncbi:right-handed parallel beta-helix repeat-containing protein [candidate division KSB1 bacterium]|nr:right-handed parallel beta-helix repeat-containing protein [candidate division KSB1 bacterium]
MNRLFHRALTRRARLFLPAILCFWASAQATTYYLDATGGTDTNLGRSPDAAWKSAEKISNRIFAPGDSIRFKRGEVFRGSVYLTASGTPGKPIVIAAYGTGDKPVLTAVDELTGWQEAEKWSLVRQSVYALTWPSDPRRLWIDGQEKLRTDDPDKIDGGEHGWAFEDGRLYLFSAAGNPAAVFHSLQGNRHYNTLFFKKQSHIEVSDLDIRGGSGHAVAIWGCQHIAIRECRFGLGARMGVHISDQDGVASHDIQVVDNRIDSGFHFEYGPPEFRGVEDGVLINHGAFDCLIQNNTILDWGHCGVYLYANRTGTSGVYNNRILDNLISGENLSYMRGIGTDGWENQCHHNEFAYNIIHNTTVRNQINGNHNRVHHNIIAGVRNSPVKNGGTAQGIDLQGYGENAVCHHNSIDHNLIIDCEEAGIRLRADVNDKRDNLVRNNILYRCGTRSRDGLDHCALVIDTHESIYRNTFQNNCIYNPEAARTVRYRGANLTVEELQRLDGHNQNTFGGTIAADPLLVDPKGGTYRLAAGSPCIDAGIATDLQTDFDGQPIPQGACPDIGPFEFSGSTGVATAISSNKPKSFVLLPNFPNPFNQRTVLSFELANRERVRIDITNLRGEQIACLLDDTRDPGRHQIVWNATDVQGKPLPSGIYIVHIHSQNERQTRALLLLR